jgi:hypothetical protein
MPLFLIFGVHDGGSTFLRNIGKNRLTRRRKEATVCCLHDASLFVCITFNPQYRGDMFSRNVGKIRLTRRRKEATSCCLPHDCFSSVLLSILNIEATCFPETSVAFQRTTWRYMSEDTTPQE